MEEKRSINKSCSIASCMILFAGLIVYVVTGNLYPIFPILAGLMLILVLASVVLDLLGDIICKELK